MKKYEFDDQGLIVNVDDKGVVICRHPLAVKDSSIISQSITTVRSRRRKRYIRTRPSDYYSGGRNTARPSDHKHTVFITIQQLKYKLSQLIHNFVEFISWCRRSKNVTKKAPVALHWRSEKGAPVLRRSLEGGREMLVISENIVRREIHHTIVSQY
jgi:hypothetical protein